MACPQYTLPKGYNSCLRLHTDQAQYLLLLIAKHITRKAETKEELHEQKRRQDHHDGLSRQDVGSEGVLAPMLISQASTQQACYLSVVGKDQQLPSM